MSGIYYIDGYNVIYRCEKLKKLARRNFEASRDALIDKVCRYCSLSGDTARIVFDGSSRHGMPEHSAPPLANVEVVYSPGHQSADTIIERFVHQARKRSDIIVVTGDRGIRDFCRGLGALVMMPDSYLAQMDEKLLEARVAIRHQTERHSGATVEDRLAEPSLARLRKHADRLKAHTRK